MVGIYRLRWLLIASVLAITSLLLFPTTNSVQAQGPSDKSSSGVDRSAPSKAALSPVEVTTGNFGGVPLYGVNLRVSPSQFLSANTAALEPATVIGTIPATYSLFGGDFINDNFTTLYAIDDLGDRLVTVNTSTGAVTDIGSSVAAAGHTWSGLKWDRTTNILYASSTAGTTSILYTINQSTGAATQVGTIGAYSIIDISISPTGQMYGVEITNDNLVSINKATGAGTIVGPLGIAASFAQGSDFNDTTGVLYWASYTGGGVNAVATVNLATGAATAIGSFTNREVDAFAIPLGVGGPTNTPTSTPSGPTNTPTATATQPTGNVVTYCSTFAPVTIPDNLPAAGVTTTLTIPAAATILDANVRISATHSWVGDLTMRLTNGTTSTIILARPGGTGTAVGCNDNNIDDNFVDDEGTGNWESACTNTNTTPAYPAGTRMVGGDPANTALMSVYDGASTAGTWSLYVTDSAAQDTGTLNQFCMEFLVSGGSTPTATATNTAVNTPTATPTVGATNTATATPGSGGGRVCSSTVVTIPDNLPGGATSTINVGTAGNISDINVVLSATHSFAGDLLFNLSNGATNVTFYDRPGVPTTTFGCGGDNIPGSIADDEGSTGSWENSCGSGNPAFQPGGTYTNNNPLSAFDGQAATGTWTLTVSDNAAADTGTLDGWCVDIATGTGPTPTATATATTTGGAPDINVTPNAFTETHGTPQTTNDTMNIQNVGSGTLTWTIVEDNSVTPVEDITDKVVVPAQDVRLRAANGSVVAERFLQSGAMAPSFGTINLVVDDGTPEDSIGLTAGGEFIWLNRFTPAPTDFPFTLTSIEFLTIGTSGCLPTDTVDFYVYTDADGNPANGATHVGSLTNQQVGTLDQYNTYATNINVTGSGDVLILAVNRTCDIAGQFPASIDLTASQVRSWVGFGGTPGNPPTLPATTFGTIDSFGFPGNWTIRGNGTQGGGGCSAPTDIPWLTVSPTNGSTAGGGSTPVTLTYNSASLADGTYTANLCIESNDADEPTVTVPITLNVGLPSAIDLASFSSPMAGVNFGDIAAAGLLLLAGAVLLLRRK